MHSAALHLAPMLAAEKSKVPFYIAGGLLVAWALIVSLGLGLRRVDFPATLQAERATIAVTVVLVLAAVSTAVITAGGGTESAGAAASKTPAPTGGTPAPSSSPTVTTNAPPTKPVAPSTGATSLALAANPGGLLSFNTRSLTAKSGTVTITFRNDSPLEHNVTIAQGTRLIGSTP